MQATRNEAGQFDAYAWPGGYPIFYVVEDNAVICPACANGENGSLAHDGPANGSNEDKQWRIVACDVHWEGAPLTCEHCNAEIESAYGDVE